MPHDAHPTGRGPIRSWHGDTDARRREQDGRRPAPPPRQEPEQEKDEE